MFSAPEQPSIQLLAKIAIMLGSIKGVIGERLHGCQGGSVALGCAQGPVLNSRARPRAWRKLPAPPGQRHGPRKWQPTFAPPVPVASRCAVAGWAAPQPARLIRAG